MPDIVLAIGCPFLIMRIVYVARVWFGTQYETLTPRQIMDTGFRIGQDPKAERRRFIQIAGAITVLYGGIWMIGFHIMLPVWTFVYMHLFGKVRLIFSLIVSLIMLGVIIGVYDYLLETVWNEPLLLQLFH